MATCYKCKQIPGAYKLRNHLVCSDCFCQNIQHVFRATLKNLHRPRKQDMILACISGGANSSAMLHLLSTCRDPAKSNRIMQFQAEVLYIDDSILYGPSDTQSFIQEVSRYPFVVHIVRIEEFYPDIIEKLEINQQSRSDLFYIYLHQAIADYAQNNGYKKVITGESASRISSMVFSEICKGRASQVNLSSSAEYKIGQISIGRPLKEFLDKEICIYQKLKSLPVLPKLPLTNISTLPNAGSIDLLIQDFISNLQNKFPSTTHTLLRTSNKLMPVPLQDLCTICNRPRDAPIGPLEAFHISREDICYACHHFLIQLKENSLISIIRRGCSEVNFWERK